MQTKVKPRSKYRSVWTACGRPECGKHQSKSEAIRCGELQCLERGKLIRDLKYQPKYDLYAVGCLERPTEKPVKVGKYISDWCYTEFDQGAWVPVVEDRKGMRTAVFNLKAKILKANYGIVLRLTR